jgi:hypothetical protein
VVEVAWETHRAAVAPAPARHAAQSGGGEAPVGQVLRGN